MSTAEAIEKIRQADEMGKTLLDLSNLGLTKLPDSIGKLSNLVTLVLDGNQLSTLPVSIGQLSNLEWLYLDGNQFSTLPDSIGQLSSLGKLVLGGNQLSTLPDSIGQLSSLREFDLGGNQLSTLPDSIGQLSSLRMLDLGGNQLSTLPDSIGQLSNLEWFDLGGNQLSTLPDSIGQLSNLEWLDFGGNQLGTLPESIGQLSGLREFELSGNQLSNLPDSIGQLSKLWKLDLDGNQLSTLPDSIGQLSGLSRLGLDGNQLSALPDSIGQLSGLSRLVLGRNQLSTLPDSIGQLSGLSRLDLGHNQLSTLPDSIGQLSSLREFDLGGNQLGTLPESIGQLSGLRELDLSGNQLSTLPVSVGQLSGLRGLDLSGNQIVYPPDRIVRKGAEMIVDYLHEQADSTPYLLLYAKSESDHRRGHALSTIFNKIEDRRIQQAILREANFEFSENSDYLRRLMQENQNVITATLFRFVDPSNDEIANLVKEGALVLPKFSVSDAFSISFPLTFSTNTSHKNAVPLIDLTVTSTVLTEMFIDLANANRPCGIISTHSPEVTVENGSVKYTIAGGPFSVGIGILLATGEGMKNLTAGIVASGSLTLMGLIEEVIEWKKLNRETASNSAKVQNLQPDTQFKKEILRSAQEKPGSETEQAENKIILPASSRVPRSIVTKTSEQMNISEGYTNHILNRTQKSQGFFKRNDAG